MNKINNVYIALTVDILHHGHINLIEAARGYGKLTVGILTDTAVANYKKLPLLNFDQRKKIIENIKGVLKVVPQTNWDYSQNIKKYKPDIFVHGDDWTTGNQLNLRKNALIALKIHGGKLVEIPYTKGISSSALRETQNLIGSTPEVRLKSLKRLLNSKKFLRIMETHSPISAIIAENISYRTKKELKYFDGFWSSSLTDATMMGKPDNESLDISERLSKINHIFEVTSKPLIMDIDTGGKIEHLTLNVKSIERLGISAVIMEDKKGLKKNSLFGNEVTQLQDSPDEFSKKISVIKKNQSNPEFMIIARIESLILGKGIDDAIKRSKKYIKAGADGIMIHSKNKNEKEIFIFAKKFRQLFKDIPLVSVPTSYNSVYEKDLIKQGFNIVIYANHLFRASYPSMSKTAKSILKNGRSKEVDQNLMSIKDILHLIPGTK